MTARVIAEIVAAITPLGRRLVHTSPSLPQLKERLLKQIRQRLTYANVMSSLAVFLILGGATAFAAVKKIGANEIKANSIKTGKIVKEAVTSGKIKNGAVIETKIADGAVTTNKIADNAVTTSKIANDAVTGDKVKESTLGQVPSAATATTATTATSATNATNAVNATEAQKVGGHSASCPANTTLIRGVCFDSVSNPPASSVFEASDSCRSKGGYLPTGLELRSTRDQLDLGGGVGTDKQYTDSIFTESGGTEFFVMAIEDGGGFTRISTIADQEYICAYPLVR